MKYKVLMSDLVASEFMSKRELRKHVKNYNPMYTVRWIETGNGNLVNCDDFLWDGITFSYVLVAVLMWAIVRLGLIFLLNGV